MLTLVIQFENGFYQQGILLCGGDSEFFLRGW